MKRTLKLIFRNLMIYTLVFVMFFGSVINDSTVALLREIVVKAGTFDGSIDVGNPQSASGGIISNPCYAYPAIQVSLLYDANTQLEVTEGREAFYNFWNSRYPAKVGDNSVQGSLVLVSHASDFKNRGVDINGGRNWETFRYSGGEIESENGRGLSKTLFLGAPGISGGQSGVFYDIIKTKDKADLEANWQQYCTDKTRAEAAWNTIVGQTGEGGHGNTTQTGIGRGYDSFFNPNGYNLFSTDGLTEEQSTEMWLRTLDCLMSLYALSVGKSSQADYARAVENQIKGESVAIMCEVCPVLVFNSHTSKEFFGSVPVMDYISYATGVTTGNLVYGADWYMDGMDHLSNDNVKTIETMVNNSLVADPNKNRYPSQGHFKDNAWSWGLTATTVNSIRTGQDRSTMWWEAPTVPTAFMNALGITYNTNIWALGYTIFGTSGSSPVESIGILSATPDNYHLGGATFGTNVSLTLYGGASEQDLASWSTIIQQAKNKGGNFTVKVNWSRDSFRETDASGLGTFIDPSVAAKDPFLPSNSTTISRAEDAKAATVVNNPTIAVFSPDEMADWISGRRAITAYDAISGYKVMHTNTKIDYIANIEITLPDGSKMTGTTGDTASFLMHEERIGYASTPQAYAEFKNYGVQSDLDGFLMEDFEAMAGVPSTEQMYFAAGGSEFIVDIGLNEAADETAYRTYDYYYTQTNCEYYSGDNSGSHSIGGVSGNTHSGGTYTAARTWTGTCPYTFSAGAHGSYSESWDCSAYNAALAEATAYAAEINATVLTYTSASDHVTRSHSGWDAHPVPTMTHPGASAGSCTPIIAVGPDGNEYQAGCTDTPASPGSTGSYSITVVFTIPCHILCGPCCEHIIPETHDTWTQSYKYDSMEINNIHVWRIDQGAIEGMEELLDLEYVAADILGGEENMPKIFYNIALKNEPNYKSRAFGPSGKASHHARAGRMVYSVERDMCDTVSVCLGSRSPQCDGLTVTCGHNVSPVAALGHGHPWAEGFIYTLSTEGYGSGRTGNPSHGETDYKLNPRNTINNAIETAGSSLALNWVTEKTNKAGSIDSKDWSTPEYKGFVEKRNQKNTATMVTDFLILQTSSGEQSVMYFDQKQQTYVDAEMPNIDANGYLLNHTEGGALRNEVNGVDATAIPGGPISSKYWYSNPNSASGWDEYEINIGSYTGMYWLGNEGNGGGSTKFDGTGRSNAKATMFDDGPHGSLVMTKPAQTEKMMMYTGELNLKLDLENEAYYTDYAEVFFANQLHWARSDWLRLNPEKNGLHLPFVTDAGTSDFANFARLDTGSFVFDGEDDASGRHFFYDTNTHAKSYGGVMTQAFDVETMAKHQFDIEDYRLAAGFTQEAVYSDSTVGGNDYGKVNDIIIHDPISTEDTALVSLPEYRDQRTGDIIGGASDVTNSINENIVCPEEPGLCSHRVLNCHFLEDDVIFNTTFTPDANGNFVNTVTGNSLMLQPGFTLDKNNNFNAYALRAYGTRISIPFTEMGLSYNTSTRIRVEADIIINPSGKGQMIFSFNGYDLYLPASSDQGLNENRSLTLNTGNGWERKVDIPVADGRKHHIAVDFAFNNIDNCKVYVDGRESTFTRLNESRELTPNLIGNNLNIGSWGTDENYGANFWLDNFKVTRLAGTMRHGAECYSVVMTHNGGQNAHNHTEGCLDVLQQSVAPGMETKVINGKLWGRIFYHNMTGGFFNNENEALSTNTTYKYSALSLIQELKPKNDDKYTFRLEYPNGIVNVWKQTNRPQDEQETNIGDWGDATNNPNKAKGFEAISIGTYLGEFGGLVRSSSGATLLDGATYDADYWYSIGSYKWDSQKTVFPGANSQTASAELWMLLDDSYNRVNEDEISTTFNYTGKVQEFTVPISGYYRLEAWGASGGAGTYDILKGSHGGQGGYTAGTVYLNAGTKLYIYVGEKGTYSTAVMNDTDGAWNGGGARYGSTACGSATGGGASDIRLTGGNWDNTTSLQNRILVAGGGGGTDDNTGEALGGGNDGSGGHGGGLTGQAGRVDGALSSSAAGGGQTSGTAFGKGGDCGCNTDTGAGGGGWYGGVASHNNNGGAGGGSSYVNGYPGCDTRYTNPNYVFSNVSMTQGGNIGHGKVVITRMTSTLANVMYWLYSGEKNEAELRELLGDAYEYVVAENQMTELYTYANWSKTNNGFYHLTNGVNVDINKDGSFTIDTIQGWECASATDIDGSALREVIITYKGNQAPNTNTGVSFVFENGTESKEFMGTYSTNENGDTVCKITLDQSVYGNKITAIKYDLGSSTPSTATATVKSIQLNGHGSTSKETRIYKVSTSNTPGQYSYEANAFGNALYDVEIIGARGGDARIVNTETVVKRSGGVSAAVLGQASFGANDKLLFTVGGKGGDQASLNANYMKKTLVDSKTTSGNGSYTFKAGKTYLVEMYGAQGGGGTVGTGASHGGYGGYTSGIIKYDTDQKLYYYVGGKGTAATYNGVGGGYNGGGHGALSGYGGGGMTHLTTVANDAAVAGVKAVEVVAPDKTYTTTTTVANTGVWYNMCSFTCYSHGTQSVTLDCSNNHINYMRLVDSKGNVIVTTDSVHGTGNAADVQNGGKSYGEGNHCYRTYSLNLTEGETYTVQLYSSCSSIKGQSATVQCKTSGGYTNNYTATASGFNQAAALLVAGGGGGADNAGGTAGGNDDGSGGNGGGTTGGNGMINGVASQGTSQHVGTANIDKTFYYTGGVQSITLQPGTYTIEAWGASGGGTASMIGQGGYTKGTVYIDKTTTLYVHVGQEGVRQTSGAGAPATYNGGGDGGRTYMPNQTVHLGGSGGGASDVRLLSGAWNNAEGLKSRILVAGGGGGSGCASNHNPGHGGGLTGATTRNASGSYAGASASGGSQTAGGKGVGSYKNTGSSAGSFGKGGNAAQCAAGGGGGYYGGGTEYTAGGGGGSSFAAGWSGCSTAYTSYHGGLKFTNVTLQQGGNTGNGRVRIYSDESKSGLGGSQVGGFAPGAGMSVTEKTDTGGAGGGYFGGFVTNNNNGGAGGGSGYVNSSKTILNYGGYVSETKTSTHTGDGAIYIYELSDNRVDGFGGYNGGGNGGIEYAESSPESAAGGGGATDLKVNGTITMVAGGGGGAGSHIDSANTVNVAYGGSASTLTSKGATTNNIVEAGYQGNGYKILDGQPGEDGDRYTNSGGVGGAGGGYKGGKQIATNTSSYAYGGAGGGSYANGLYSKLQSYNIESPDGSGNGYYKLEEYRETIIIRTTNYDEKTANVLMQYYTLIPEKLSDGSPNPLWSNCNKEGNYHECTHECGEIKMLTCSEPHHQGLHYDVANEICWEACMNDANHRQSTDDIQVSSDHSFEIGNFINIDYGFTIFFPNRGDFEEGQQYAIGSLSSAKGLGYTNVYEVDEDYSHRPYGPGTDMSDGYVDTEVGMNTSKWTRVKRIKFPVNVIYDPTRDGRYAKLYLAGEWITLGDRGLYTGELGGEGDSVNDGKYDETAWSNYGKWEYDAIYKEFYNFYCVLNNYEKKAGAYTIEVTAVNCADFDEKGNGQRNDNPNEMTNKKRKSSFRALHGGTNTQYFDVVGRIGNLIMEDVEDFRFSNLFKETVDSDTQTQVKTNTYYVNKGLGAKDSFNTENPNASVDNTYVTTNAGNAYAAVKGVSVGSKYYRITFEGKGLNVGRLEVVNVATRQAIEANKITVIQESSNKVSYYLDLSSVNDVTQIDIKWVAKGSNVMAVNSCTFTELGASPDSWLLDGIVREVDETKQNVYFTYVSDIRGIKVSSKTHYVDTWGTLSWANENWMDLPLSPDKNNIDILKDEPMLAGYSALMDIQTIGSYWQNDTTELQIVPKYYALDINKGTLKKVDVYMEHEGTYVPINLADNVNKNNAANPFNTEIFNNVINLDWDNTKARRNVTGEESTKTQQVYEDSIRKESDQSGTGNQGTADVDIYRPIDIPSGHINVLGNNQYMILDGNARSFVGGIETYGELKNLGNRLNPVHWYRAAQRWHFLVGVPSSAVFVEKGKPVTAANIDELQSGPYVIISTLDITAVGEIFALKYEHRYSGSQIATDYANYYKNIVKNWTDVGTTGGPHMGTIQLKATSGETSYTKTFDLNKFAAELNYEPIVLVYSVNESSVQDVEIVGTH